MKKLVILMLVFIFTAGVGLTGRASAMTNEQALHAILKTKIGYGELQTLKYLVSKKVPFSEKDFRDLLRNYVGSGGLATAKVQTLSGLLKPVAVSKTDANCSDYQIFLKNGKLVKESAEPVCFSITQIQEVTQVNNGQNTYGNMPATYLNTGKIGHEKEFALFIDKVLKTYPNVYKNINKQGRHYQTALYIAAGEDMPHVVFILLRDGYIKAAVTAIPVKINRSASLTANGIECKSAYGVYRCHKAYAIQNFGRAWSERNKKWTPLDFAVEKKLRRMTEYWTWCHRKPVTASILTPSFMFGNTCNSFTLFEKTGAGGNTDSVKHYTRYYSAKTPTPAGRLRPSKNPFKKYKPKLVK